MNEFELDLINAIQSGDVEKTLEAFANFIPMGKENATKIINSLQNGDMENYSYELKAVSAMMIRISDLNLKWQLSLHANKTIA